MKKLIWMIVLVFILMLTSCRVADEGLSGGEIYSTEDAKLLGYSQWEYQMVTAHCNHDGDSGKVVCQRFDNNDSTYLGNLLESFETQDWEYVDCITTGDGQTILQTFIFRKLKEFSED